LAVCRLHVSDIVRIRRFLLLALAVVPAAACDDNLFPDLPVTADTTTVYSLARPELSGYPSAFNIAGMRLVVVEAKGATPNWDVALSERDGSMVLLPAGAITGVPAQAGVAMVPGKTFEEVRTAPRDTAAYERRNPVPVEVGRVYVARSRAIRRLGIVCYYYAKLQPLSIDQSRGAVSFEVVANPNCSDRSLEVDEE